MLSDREPNSCWGWLPDEVATAGRENLDGGHVSRYDAKEDAGAADEVLLCKALGLNGESVVVDVGAGTGQFVMAVASACARVVAVDVSPVMLKALRAKVDEARLTNVEVVQAGFLTYEHHGTPADFVYSRYALDHLPDFWKAVALERLHRVLRPGGVLAYGTSSTASIRQRQRIASKLGAPPGALMSTVAGAVPNSKNMFATNTRRSAGFSS